MKQKIVAFAVVIVAIVSTVTCVSRPTKDEIEFASMQENINVKMNFIDRASQIISFDDTIGEGDDYMYMMKYKDSFEYAEDIDVARAYYESFCDYFNKVHNKTIELIQYKAKCDTLDHLPVHVCK